MKCSLVSVLSIVLVGCGSPKHASEPRQPVSPPAQQGADTSTFAPGASSSPPAESEVSPTLQVTDWQHQFSETLADLERLDCPNACRALGSLERSAENICGIAGGTSSTCQDVQKKREDARSRVRTRCGVCP